MLSLKYNERQIQLPNTRLLKEVYNVDKSLYEEGHRSWYAFIHKSLDNLKANNNTLNIKHISSSISNWYADNINTELNCLKNKMHENKLHVFAKCLLKFWVASILIIYFEKINHKIID